MAIVIMVTVLAAVIPVLSPNNDARKIREASRQLSSMLAQAQAQAARDGRPYGIEFQESLVGGEPSGTALEAYFVSEPASFSGFSASSQVRFLIQDDPSTAFPDSMVTAAQFVSAGQMFPANGTNQLYALDPPPPRTLRLGDAVSAGGFLFTITDQDRDGDGNSDVVANDPNSFQQGDLYQDAPSNPRAQFACTLAGGSYYLPRAVVPYDPPALLPPPSRGWTNPLPYKIKRQAARASDAALQFPRGIGIDLQASGTNLGGDFDAGGVRDVVRIMFSPNGSISSFALNGVEVTAVDRIFLLLGVTENGNAQQENYDFLAFPPIDDAELQQRRRKVNWLRPDARWVTIQTRSGRAVTSENYIYNPLTIMDGDGDQDFDGDGRTILEDRGDQRSVARRYARDMLSSGGR
ncbi:MAG: hypothetical protein IT424_13195 [Pirellulales bacterium]|nr:hypothetical protein [Pirellulales bacterium]